MNKKLFMAAAFVATVGMAKANMMDSSMMGMGLVPGSDMQMMKSMDSKNLEVIVKPFDQIFRDGSFNLGLEYGFAKHFSVKLQGSYVANIIKRDFGTFVKADDNDVKKYNIGLSFQMYGMANRRCGCYTGIGVKYENLGKSEYVFFWAPELGHKFMLLDWLSISNSVTFLVEVNASKQTHESIEKAKKQSLGIDNLRFNILEFRGTFF